MGRAAQRKTSANTLICASNFEVSLDKVRATGIYHAAQNNDSVRVNAFQRPANQVREPRSSAACGAMPSREAVPFHIKTIVGSLVGSWFMGYLFTGKGRTE
jgi:hypothetical protein